MPPISLEQIEIPKSCPASWNKMRGNNVSRFCQHCQKHVYDLSAMPRSRAEQLVCQSAGDLCVRMKRAADGQVMTLDYQPSAAERRWSWKVWTNLALGASLVTGVVNAAIFGHRVFPPPTRMPAGAIMLRPTPTTPPSGAPGPNVAIPCDRTGSNQ